MRKTDFQEIMALDGRYRANFINSLWGYRPLALVGTANQEGQNNLCIVNSLFHVGANPPMAGMLFRPATTERHSLENIIRAEEYSLNLIPYSVAEKAHQTSAKYPREVSEFEAIGLNPVVHSDFSAPLVLESPVRIGMKLVRHIHLTENDTNLIIGKVLFIEIAEDMVESDGFVHHRKADIACGSGLDSYHRIGNGKRYSYARPGIDLRELFQ